MPSGATTVRYEGKRGVVWRVKYRDADGRQVQETLGREADGWTKRKAEAELRARLTDVRREGRRKVKAVTLATFAREWLDTYPAAKGLKRSTTDAYRSIIDLHLSPALGHHKLEALTVGHVETYLAGKRRKGYAPRTLNRHLNLLHELYVGAIRRGLVRTNPVALVDRPRESRRRWRILGPPEIAAIERAFRQLAEDEKGEERSWREQARTIFLTAVDTGLRRGELQGLHWRDVELADPEGPKLRVRETWVRSGVDTPKSEAGERTIALDSASPVPAALFEHRGRSAFSGEGERVFTSQTGAPFDVARYARTFRLALAKAGISDRVRPFHDLRHTAITNDAASGMSGSPLMTKHGHSSFKTTQGYIDLAGETFREEAKRAAQRKFAHVAREPEQSM